MKNIKKYVHWKVVFTLFFMGLLGAFNPVAAQRPQPLSSLERSLSPDMMMMSNGSRYASYKYFSEWLSLYSDSLNILNPFWLGSILPTQNVNIAAAGNNLTFSQGGIFSFVADTSLAPAYNYQFNINPKIAGGQGLFRAQNVSNGYYNGLFFNQLGLTLFADNNLILANPQVQSGLTPGTYVAEFDESGTLNFVSKAAQLTGIFAVQDSQKLTSGSSFYRDSINNIFAIGSFADINDPYLDSDFGLYANQKDVLLKGDGSGLAVSENYAILSSRINNSATYGTGYFLTNTNKATKRTSLSIYYSGSEASSQLKIDIGNNLKNGDGAMPIDSGMVVSSFFGGTKLRSLGVEVHTTTSDNTVFMYDEKYRFANEQPSTTSGETSLHTWNGTGATTTPDMITTRELFQFAAFQVTSVNNTYTSQEPITNWSLIRNSGAGSPVLQGDTMFVFPTEGTYEVKFDLILYSLVSQSDFSINPNNVTGFTPAHFGNPHEGGTIINGGTTYVVTYVITTQAPNAQFTLDLLGTGVGTVVRQGSRCTIKRLY